MGRLSADLQLCPDQDHVTPDTSFVGNKTGKASPPAAMPPVLINYEITSYKERCFQV